MKKFLSFLIGVLLFISCSKEEEYIIEYPTTFSPSEIYGQKIRVFTKKGEIKDSKIRHYLINCVSFKISG